MATRPHRRIEFDDELLAELCRVRRRRRKPARTRRRWPWRLGAVAVAGLLIGWMGTPLRSKSDDEHALKHMAAVLIASLAENNLREALALWAKGEVQIAVPGEVEGSVVAAGAPQEQPPPTESTHRARLALLEKIRSDLEKAGVRWDAVRLLAFGGVRARVHDSAGMTPPETRTVGDLYFTSRGKVFAIELSACEVKGVAFLIELWRWLPLDVAPEGVEDHWRRRCQSFEREPVNDDQAVTLSRVRRVFIVFQPQSGSGGK